MTTITLTGDNQLALVGLDLTGVWNTSHAVFHDSQGTVVGYSNADFVFEGTGFNSFDSHGYATSGTITHLAIILGDSRVDFTDISLSALQLEKMFKHGDSVSFAKIIFGGDDTITLNKGGAAEFSGSGDDTVTGLAGDDQLYGGTGDDHLMGGAGKDNIHGDFGSDTLTGGAGADAFDYGDVADSKKGGVDTITDLSNADTIDLSHVDANKAADDVQHFTLVAAFSGAAGELTVRFDAGHNRTVIAGDVTGDGKADMIIYASGNHASFTNFDLG